MEKNKELLCLTRIWRDCTDKTKSGRKISVYEKRIEEKYPVLAAGILDLDFGHTAEKNKVGLSHTG